MPKDRFKLQAIRGREANWSPREGNGRPRPRAPRWNERREGSQPGGWSMNAADALPPPHRDGYQPTVLIIEDDEQIRFGLTALLVRSGYSVLTAATGHDALAMLRQPFSAID